MSTFVHMSYANGVTAVSGGSKQALGVGLGHQIPEVLPALLPCHFGTSRERSAAATCLAMRFSCSSVIGGMANTRSSMLRFCSSLKIMQVRVLVHTSVLVGYAFSASRSLSAASSVSAALRLRE